MKPLHSFLVVFFFCVLVIHLISQSVGSLFVLARLATRGSMIKCWPASLRMLVVVPVRDYIILHVQMDIFNTNSLLVKELFLCV